MTRFYFLISVQGIDHPDAQHQHVIVNCTEIVGDEIWLISISSPSKREEYYVLESTCEVIGCSDGTVHCQYKPDMVQPRIDWSSYIAQCATQSSERSKSCLFDRLKWNNQEDYAKGISKHWLKRMREEGQGHAKAKIALKYILACVVANRYSFAITIPSESH